MCASVSIRFSHGVPLISFSLFLYCDTHSFPITCWWRSLLIRLTKEKELFLWKFCFPLQSLTGIVSFCSLFGSKTAWTKDSWGKTSCDIVFFNIIQEEGDDRDRVNPRGYSFRNTYGSDTRERTCSISYKQSMGAWVIIFLCAILKLLFFLLISNLL